MDATPPMKGQQLLTASYGAYALAPTSPTSAPVPGADIPRPILKLDLDALCDRLNVSTRELVKKLGGRDRFDLEEEDDPTRPRSAAVGIAGPRVDPHLGISPQVITSLVGSQGRWGPPPSLRTASPGGLRPVTNDSMNVVPAVQFGETLFARSPSGFGFLVGRRPPPPPEPAPYREHAPLLGGTPTPRLGASPSVVGFLSSELHLRRKHAGLDGGEAPDTRQRATTSAAHSGAGSFGRTQSLNAGLCHRAAFIIPSGTEGMSLVAVPQHEERVPLKKRLRLPKIPPEVQSVELVTRVEWHESRVYVIVKYARPLFGWMVLLAGVTMMATVGPISAEILKIQVNGRSISGFMLGSWNAQGLVLCFFSWSVISWLMGDWTEATHRYFFSLKGMSLMMAAGIISGAGSGCWTLSFTQTTVEQSYLFNSFHPTLIILCRLLTLQPIYIGETLGLALGLMGAAVSAFTPDDNHSSKLFGDALAFMSSISLCFYLLFSKRLRPHLPLPAMLTVVCFFSAVTQTCMALAVEHEITPDRHPTHGIFGYLNGVYLHWWLFMLLVTAVGQAGYIGALKYLTPVVVSISMTTEPVMAMVIGNLLSHFLHQPVEWPTPLSLSGGLLIVLGSMVVSYFSRHSADGVEVDVTEVAEPFALPEDSP